MALVTGRVVANGIDFHYLEVGRGPLVLCLHGFPDNAHTYDELLPALAAAGFRGVAPFMRGYAPTAPAPDGRYQAVLLAQDALALIDSAADARSSSATTGARRRPTARRRWSRRRSRDS
jgi:pimeloyl-ACP methyl ester carboxylesterase